MEAQAAFDVVKSTSKEQTQKAGISFGKNLKPGDVVALYGDLGSGKTTLVQGIAYGLGIKRRILSPTFVFLRSYPIVSGGQSLILNHLDLYRVDSKADVQTLSLDELLTPNAISVIEWADKIKNMLPKKRIDVFLETVGENERRIKIKRYN